MTTYMNTITDLWTWLEKGGLVMIPLLICSILGLAIVLVKFLQLRQRKILTPEIVDLVRSLKVHKDVDLILRICQEKKGPFARIIIAGLENRDLPFDGIKEAIEDRGRQETRSLERGLVALDTIAVIAPLLGLLGTVLGMVDVFNEIAGSVSVQATQLSRGISKALITTVVGLSIGIPALVAYNFLVSKVDSLILDIENYSAMLFHKLRRFTPEKSEPEEHDEMNEND